MESRRRLRRHWREYASISPFFILFAAFSVIPLGYALYLSTLRWDGIGDPVHVGLAQWSRLFSSSDFWYAAGNTIIIFLMGQVPVIIGALIAATLLSQPRLRARGLYQTAFFLPQVTSLVVVAVVFQAIFSNRFGLANVLLQASHIPTFAWLTNPWGIRVVLAAMVIWRGFGYFLLIFMSGLSAIDQGLYEAARLDGAGPTRILGSITLPLLRPTVVFVALTGTISGLQMFTEPQLLFGGGSGPNQGGLTMMLLQYQYLGGPGAASSQTAVTPDLGYASVIGWAVFIMLLIVAVITYRLTRTREDI